MYERFMHQQVVIAHKFPIMSDGGAGFLSAQGKLIGTGPDSITIELGPGRSREIPLDSIHHVENHSEIEIPPVGIALPKNFRPKG